MAINLSGLLKATGAGFAGYGQDKERIAADALQKRALERQGKQDAIAEQIRLRAEARPAMIAKLYGAARAGDVNAQGELVGEEAAKYGDFDPPTPKAPAKPELQVVDGQVVDLGAAKATPIAGYVAPKKEPSPVQADLAEQRKFQRTQALGQDFKNNPSVKRAYELSNVASGIKAGLSGDAPVDDLSLIYETVKLFDPNSAVREGEISLFKKAQSLPQQLGLIVERWNSGRTLTPEMRQQIGTLLDRKIAESETGVRPVQAEFGAQARRYGVEGDSSFIAPDPFKGLKRDGHTDSTAKVSAPLSSSAVRGLNLQPVGGPTPALRSQYDAAVAHLKAIGKTDAEIYQTIGGPPE